MAVIDLRDRGRRERAINQGVQNIIGGLSLMENQKARERALLRQQGLDANLFERQKKQDERQARLDERARAEEERRAKREVAKQAREERKEKREEAKQERTFGLKERELDIKKTNRLAKEEKDILDRDLKRSQLTLTKGKIEDRESGKKPSGRLRKLSAEARGKVGSIASGFDALTQMKNALAGGSGPRRIDPSTNFIGDFVGDTEFTKAQRVLSEVVGRLQSGGAIQAEELRTFRAMGPRPADSVEIAQKKLNDQMSFLENKAIAFGFSKKELGEVGFNIGELSPQALALEQKVLSGGNQRSLAPEVIQQNRIKPAAQAALEEALKDPDDPRSIKTFQLLGVDPNQLNQ